MNMQKGAIAAMAVVAGLQGLPVMAFAEPTASGSGIDKADGQQYDSKSSTWVDSSTESATSDDANDRKENTYDGKIHLFYDTTGGKWQDPGQDAIKADDNHDHDNGTYMLTIPTKIHYQNMNVGKVNTSDDYTVNVRGAIADGATITVTAETGKVMSNGVESGITETTTQGKTSWTSQEAYGGLNQDGSLKGTDCTDNIKMTGEVKMAGQYEGSVKYEASLTNSADSGSVPAKKARTADEIAALQTDPTNIASGTWGTCPWWISSDGTLNIETGTGANATDDGMPWGGYAEQIKAFEGPSGGNKIVMPANSRYMFNGCSGLTSLNLASLKTDNVTDMSWMFSDCSGLTSLDLTPLKTDNVTDMDDMFEGCSGLTSLDLTPLKTDNVTDMSCMFYGCSGLTSLDLSSLKTDNVTNMVFMFYDCSNLTSLRTGDTFGVKAIDKATLPRAMTMDGTTDMNSGDYLADGAHVYTAR